MSDVDLDLVFDSTASLKQTLTFNRPGQNITVNLDLASDPSSNGSLGVGNGSLTIRNGVVVNSARGYIGAFASATGVATVDGPGSSWTAGGLYVGSGGGNGALNITGGGSVSGGGDIGYATGSKGVVTVDGAGSSWTGAGLGVGSGGGNGTLNITGGGSVSNSLGW